MVQSSVEKLAYFIKNSKEKPIVFLGAGASASGEIPLAKDIVDDILDKFHDNPYIKELSLEEKTYANLMDCLTPLQRNELLRGYIKNGKINVSHIYLAQLIKEGLVDYVLTVNFDNLMLRALALFNIYPPIYDLAILKDLTTDNFKEKSLFYLHGQHHGLWLLNTNEEMEKVDKVVPAIFNRITGNRPWIVVGYSGEDRIFDHIKNLQCFNNGLYWVTYKNSNPSDKVLKELLNKKNSHSKVIKGYDSDHFFLELNRELGLEQPSILKTPFSSLKEILENIVDIEDNEELKAVKERLEISKKQVSESIAIFERGKGLDLKKISVDKELLKKEIIDKILKKDFSDIEKISKSVEEVNETKLSNLLSKLYLTYGNSFYDKQKFKDSIKYYEKAIKLDPNYTTAFNNWGNALADLGKIDKDKELYRESISKYEKAVELDPNFANTFNNWGATLADLGRIDNDKKLYEESISKYEKAVALDQNFSSAFNNWGSVLLDLGRIDNDKELYKESISKYKKAVELDPNFASVFSNWGIALSELGKIDNNKELYKDSINKYKKAVELDPNYANAFSNWGTVLIYLYHLTNEVTYLDHAEEKAQKAYSLGENPYNLSCVLALKKDKTRALKYLEESLKKGLIKPSFAKEDNDWKEYVEDKDFLELIMRYEDK